MTIFTEQHIKTARAMPRKSESFFRGDEAKKQERKNKRDRKAIAAYYRLIRRDDLEGYGKAAARIAHRYGQVTKASEANWRIGQLT